METRKRKSKKSTENEPSSVAKDTKKSPSRASKKFTPEEAQIAEESEEVSPPPKFGPMPTFPKQRLWSRTILILGVLTVIYFNTNNKTTKESMFASSDENYPGRAFETKCSPDYEQNTAPFLDCRPVKCGRIISDNILLPSELIQLLDLARRTLEYDPSISSLFAVYDLTSGKLSYQDSTVDLVKLNTNQPSRNIFRDGDIKVFQNVEAKLKHVIGEHFKLKNYPQTIYLAKPSFYARLTSKGKGSDAYSHVKVDQTNYNSFHYSAIVFLSDFGKDFDGGRFIFPDGDLTNRTVEAKKGRVLLYTSGLENKNYIEKVTKGSQLILTFGFTCDFTKAINKPRL